MYKSAEPVQMQALLPAGALTSNDRRGNEASSTLPGEPSVAVASAA